MRVSVWESDAGYANWRRSRAWKVLLDGEVVERAFTADTDLGMVIRAKVDAAGQMVLDGDEIATETLHGCVELRPL